MSSRVSSTVMYKKLFEWLVTERNSDTDTTCVSVSDLLDVFGAVGKDLWKDDLTSHTDSIPRYVFYIKRFS